MMAKETDYKAVAQQIIEVVGGPGNIISVAHCATRLRLIVKNREIIDDKQLEAFSQRLLEKNQQAAKYITRFSDWEQALLSITELAKDKKIVVVIDTNHTIFYKPHHELSPRTKHQGTVCSL